MAENKKETKSIEEQGSYLLMGIIDGGTIVPAIKWILQQNLNSDNKVLDLIVSSCGGYVYDGMALIDVIRGSKIRVDTVGLGIIASMGLSIFLAGKERVITKNTYILAHQYSSGSGANITNWLRIVSRRIGCTILSSNFIQKGPGFPRPK